MCKKRDTDIQYVVQCSTKVNLILFFFPRRALFIKSLSICDFGCYEKKGSKEVTDRHIDLIHNCYYLLMKVMKRRQSTLPDLKHVHVILAQLH